jgi:ABC-2 type transport system ATP-binding protein
MKQGAEDAKIRERIGFVYDEHGFYGNMTVEGMGRLTAPFYRNWSNDEFRQRVKEFDLDPTRKVRELSRGQKTKLALAIALSHRAELLVMDEPTSGLDPVFRRELIDILYRIIQDERRAIFFSSHLTSDLEKIADYVTFIDDGRIVFSESKDGLRERYRIVKGPLEGLTRGARELCVGIRETRTGFEALSASAEDLAALVGNRAIVEKADLEDIMVYMVKGAQDE